MTSEETLRWFEEVAAGDVHHNDHGQVAKWFADAQSALESVFPEGHAISKQWHATVQDLPAVAGMKRYAAVTSARAIFQSALEQLQRGRLKTLVQSIQAETVSELLEQAQFLLADDWRVAATVVAGGALETHLHHLCVQHAITWKGDGSISRYDGAIAQERNQTGREIYSATDTKAVGAWGGLRNEAAHDPTTFNRSVEEIRLMIEGIRQFIART